MVFAVGNTHPLPPSRPHCAQTWEVVAVLHAGVLAQACAERQGAVVAAEGAEIVDAAAGVQTVKQLQGSRLDWQQGSGSHL